MERERKRDGSRHGDQFSGTCTGNLPPHRFSPLRCARLPRALHFLFLLRPTRLPWSSKEKGKRSRSRARVVSQNRHCSEIIQLNSINKQLINPFSVLPLPTFLPQRLNISSSQLHSRGFDITMFLQSYREIEKIKIANNYFDLESTLNWLTFFTKYHE